MEPLFTTQFAYTLDEYTKFNNAVMFSKNNSKRIIPAFLIIFVFFAALTYFMTYKIMQSIPFSVFMTLVFVIILSVIIPITLKKGAKKAYNSNKFIDKEISTYNFFENEFTETTSHNHSKCAYSELNQIIETKTNFYLMLSDVQGFLITKNNCSPELIEFLQGVKAKYNI